MKPAPACPASGGGEGERARRAPLPSPSPAPPDVAPSRRPPVPPSLLSGGFQGFLSVPPHPAARRGRPEAQRACFVPAVPPSRRAVALPSRRPAVPPLHSPPLPSRPARGSGGEREVTGRGRDGGGEGTGTGAGAEGVDGGRGGRGQGGGGGWRGGGGGEGSFLFKRSAHSAGPTIFQYLDADISCWILCVALVRPSLAVRGAISRSFWHVLGPSWAALVPLRGDIGAFGGHLGAILG